MNNIELFNFRFVDRVIERKNIESFLFENDAKNVLWIHGKSGVGKTALIEYCKKNYNCYDFVHVNPIMTQTAKYIACIIKELDKEQSLQKFILKNYKAIKNLTKDTISETNLKAKFVTGLLEIGENIFVDIYDNVFSTSNVITKYITIRAKERQTIIIFDNFQQCDTASLQVIQELTSNLLQNSNIKFIFVTTDNRLSSDSEVVKFLLEKIPSVPVDIKPFEKKEYFLEILLGIYSLDGINFSEMDELFKICNGIPEKLKTFLQNLYLSNGIEYFEYSNQARLMPDKFKENLCKGADNIDLESLTLIERLIFKIAICWNESLSIQLLDEVTQYVGSTALFLPQELKSQVIVSIYHLLQLDILSLEEHGIQVKHDLLYLSYLPKYNVIPEVILYSKLYEYININKDKIIELYSKSYFYINNALYSYKANVTSWEQINLVCLKFLIGQSDYNNILSVANRLETNLTDFKADDLMLLAECFYNNGKYDKSRSILNYTKDKLRSNEELFKYYYLSGKIYNILMNKYDAEKELLEAQKFVISQSEEEIMVKHMLQLVLVEIIGRKEEAKEIFRSISEHLEEYATNSRALGVLLKNCSNYYSGNDALRLLQKAEKISIEYNDLVELSFIKNNMGYEYFKMNDLKKCKILYEESIDILKQTKIHESAYPLSNLAVCYMLEDEYDKAITLINCALFWNCSSYLDFVLKTHLMLCYERNNNKEESLKLAHDLYSRLEKGNINDPVILRKVYLNLAINYDRLHLEIDAQRCSQIAYKYCIGTASEYRATKIYSKYGGTPTNDLSKLNDPYYTNCYFEHWLTIISHD